MLVAMHSSPPGVVGGECLGVVKFSKSSLAMSALRIAAFLDTNSFLHFRPLNEIDWCGILDAKAVEIKIAPVVTRELEVQKTLNPSRKLKERAATVLKLLHGYLRKNQVRPGVMLEFLIKEPTAESIAEFGLNSQLGDDRLVGTLLSFRNEHPDIACVLVTNDLSLAVKATHYEIPLVELGEDLSLPPEPDALEKRNKQLEAELHRYKSKEPVLALRFESGGKHETFEIARLNETTAESEAELQALWKEAKAKHPLIGPEPRQESALVTDQDSPLADIAAGIRQATEGFRKIGEQFCEDYNIHVRAYYRDYEKYLRDLISFKTSASRTIKLKLVLHNDGTCPAEDIYVQLHFPDGLRLYDEDDPPKAPEEPTAPSQEWNPFSKNISDYLTFPRVPNLPRFRHPSLPRIRKTNSYEVDFEVEKLQHGFVWNFKPFLVVFDSQESAQSFSIEYSISAGNLIDDVTGELGVVIAKI